jgi:hypothetical protein
MEHGSDSRTKNTRPSFQGGPRPFSISPKAEKGSILFYIFLAVALMAVLTYTFTKDGRNSESSQLAIRTAQELYVQTNLIRSAIVECTLSYPGGGGDLNADNVIDATDNPNTPYPLNPTAALNPGGPAGTDQVRNLVCVGAPAATRNIFGNVSNQGRFLPPVPAGYGEWLYINDASGVRIKIIAPTTATDVGALSRLMAKFSTCQSDLNYGSCGTSCFTAWIQRTSCP